MVAVKAPQVDQYLKSIPANIAAILIFGSDAGLVSERATMAATRMAAKSTPPGEILRLDETDIDADPDRLIVELTTIAMFGGRKIVRTHASRRVNANLVGPMLTSNTIEGVLIIEAGNLKPTEGLRPLFEKNPNAAAIPCYQDTERDLSTVIDDTLRAAKLTIAADARRLLLSRLGADRSLSRAEIEKLILYCYGRSEITVDDVEAATGDASDLAIDMIVNAAANGQIDTSLDAFERSIAAGDNPQTIIIATQRHFQRLHRVRAAYEATGNLDEAIRSLRPPLHFRQQDIFTGQVRSWSLNKASRALDMIGRVQASTRSDGHDDTILANRLIFDLGRLARWKSATENRA